MALLRQDYGGQADNLMDADEKITRLEERYAHLQRHQAEQDKVMLGLADELAKLRKELGALRARAASGGESPERTDERPPHY